MHSAKCGVGHPAPAISRVSVVRLTIVIPTTGRETLDRAVASAEHAADQVIVIADGCPHVHADLHVDCGAPGLTRNAAIPYITGDWVGFCDDDDILVPDVYRAAIEEHADAADLIVQRMSHPELGFIPRLGTETELFHGNVGISFALRASLFRDHPFIAGPPLTMRGEDYELVRRLLDQGRHVVVTGDVGYVVNPEEVTA